MTLQERLVSEAQQSYTQILNELYDCKGRPRLKRAVELNKEFRKIILHTIEQTIKEGCEVVEGKLYRREDSLISPLESHRHNDINYGFELAKTDTQHALRGIMKSELDQPTH